MTGCNFSRWGRVRQRSIGMISDHIWKVPILMITFALLYPYFLSLAVNASLYAQWHVKDAKFNATNSSSINETEFVTYFDNKERERCDVLDVPQCKDYITAVANWTQRNHVELVRLSSPLQHCVKQQCGSVVDGCSFALDYLRILLLLGGDIERNPGPETPLNTTDHYQLVRKALLTVRPQWRNIGLALGIPVFKLKEFGGSFEERTDQMLEVWLNHTYSTPTWRALVTALRDVTVEGGRPVAAEIEAKYLGEEQSVGQGTGNVTVQLPPQVLPGQLTGAQEVSVSATPRPTHQQPVFLNNPEDSKPTAPAIARYGQYLKSRYRNQAIPRYEGCQTQTKNYINLAMIHKERTSKSEMDEFTKSTVHGKIDDILHSKRSVQLRDVGKLDNDSTARCILVQGAPGAGKTTMAWELTQKWLENKLFCEYSLLVLLKMRDETSRSAEEIHQLFPTLDKELQADVSKEALRTFGEGVLFILEGYDELPQDKQECSIFLKLVEGAILPNAGVLVTSRPSASPTLFEKCKALARFQHLEIIGFAHEQIDSYITDVIGYNTELHTAFKEYLVRYPHIHGLMYNPLNCAIVIDVYESSTLRELAPKTQTELYSALTMTLIRRHFSSKPIYKQVCKSWHTLSHIPKEISRNFLKLCEVAYHGVLQQQLIFPSLPRGTDTLGLVHDVAELYGNGSSYNFLHLTLQEFLAAYHVSKQPLKKQARCIDTFFGKKHMVVVLRFVAGLTKFHIQSTEGASMFKKAGDSLKALFKSRAPLDCLTSFNLGRRTFIETLNWLFEAQEKELFLVTLGNRPQDHNCSGQALTPFDCYTLGYCIVNSDCTWKLKLQQCGIDIESARMLAQNTDGALQQVEVLDLSHNCLQSGGAVYLASGLKGNMILTELRLEVCEIGAEGTTALTQVLSGIPTLRALYMTWNSVHMESVALLVKKSNLTELYLQYCEIDGGMTCELAEAMSGSSKLTVLELNGNPIQETGASALAGMLSSNSCLKQLDLTACVSMGAGGATQLIDSLKHNSTLKTLCLPEKYKDTTSVVEKRITWCSDMSTQSVVDWRCRTVESQHVRLLVSALRVNTCITDLRLGGCHLNSDETSQLAEALSDISTLRVLDFSNNTINSLGTRHLALLLKKGNLKELYLQHSGIDDDMTCELAEAVSENNKLAVLMLNGNQIQETGTSALAALLTKDKCLVKLDLTGCTSIGAECTTKLIESLRSNSTLETLCLPDKYKNTTPLASEVQKRVIWCSESSTQRVINRSDQRLGSKDVQQLASALRGNTGLTELGLWDCHIPAEGMSQVAEALCSTSTLRVLDLGFNTVDSQGARHLALVLKRNPNLTRLELTHCSIGDDATCELMEVVRDHPSLRILWLSENPLGERGAAAVAEMLERNKTLEELSLRGCYSLGVTGVTRLIESLQHNTKLRQLLLSRKYRASELYMEVQSRDIVSWRL